MNCNHPILDEPATALAINVEDIPYYKTAHSSTLSWYDILVDEPATTID